MYLYMQYIDDLSFAENHDRAGAGWTVKARDLVEKVPEVVEVSAVEVPEVSVVEEDLDSSMLKPHRQAGWVGNERCVFLCTHIEAEETLHWPLSLHTLLLVRTNA